MLATVDPGTGDILPADDTSWEQGVCTRSHVDISHLMDYSAFIIERKFDHRFSITTENGKICTIR